MSYLAENWTSVRMACLLLQCSVAFAQSNAQLRFQSLQLYFLVADDCQFVSQKVPNLCTGISMFILKDKKLTNFP